MSTIRIARRRRFTQVDRRSAEDERLSFRARGLLVWLLSKPDDWKVDSTSIARHTTEGREAVRTAMRELETHGYLVRKRERVKGRWATETVVYEHPELAQLDLLTSAQEPVAVDGTGAQETVAGSPGVGELGAVVPEDGDKTTGTEGTTAATAAERVEAQSIVDAFWKWSKEQRGTEPTLTANGSGSPYMALVKIVERLLRAGWTTPQVKAALVATPAYTLNALTLQLNQAKGTAPAVGPRGPVDDDRSGVAGRVVDL